MWRAFEYLFGEQYGRIQGESQQASKQTSKQTYNQTTPLRRAEERSRCNNNNGVVPEKNEMEGGEMVEWDGAHVIPLSSICDWR